jgi:hypothetical protein
MGGCIIQKFMMSASCVRERGVREAEKKCIGSGVHIFYELRTRDGNKHLKRQIVNKVLIP